MNVPSFLLACSLAFASCAVSAQEETDPASLAPAKFDTDPKDQNLSVSEQNAWRRALDQATGLRGVQAANFYKATLAQASAKSKGHAGSVAVAAIRPYKPRYCEPTRGFVLRSNVSTVNLLSCQNFRAADGGATFSLTDDQEADARAAAFKFGLAYAFGAKGLGDPSATGLNPTERTYAFYLEGDGTYVSGGTNQGTLEAGLLAGWRYEGLQQGAVGRLTLLNLNTFYRTDTEFDARIYGVRASYTPVNLNRRLGGQKVSGPDDTPENALFWTFRGEAEGLRVENAGVTDLTTGDDYLWLGAVAGVVYTNEEIGPYGIKAELNGEYRVNLLDDDEAGLATSSLDFFLDKAQKTSIQLSYSKGTNYKDQTDVDKAELSFAFKF